MSPRRTIQVNFSQAQRSVVRALHFGTAAAVVLLLVALFRGADNDPFPWVLPVATLLIAGAWALYGLRRFQRKPLAEPGSGYPALLWLAQVSVLTSAICLLAPRDPAFTAMLFGYGAFAATALVAYAVVDQLGLVAWSSARYRTARRRVK